jgi:hypothetical protein
MPICPGAVSESLVLRPCAAPVAGHLKQRLLFFVRFLKVARAEQDVGIELPFSVQRNGRLIVDVPAAQVENAVDDGGVVRRSEDGGPPPSKRQQQDDHQQSEQQEFGYSLYLRFHHARIFDKGCAVSFLRGFQYMR